MKYRWQIISCFLLNLVFFAGCAGTNYKERLASIRPNMSKDELVQIMKEPGEVRSSEIRKGGQIVEVWEYTITTDVLEGEEVRFYFNFVNDRLIKWGKR
jgi:starvation-inducible outer membrane lipoprotein